MGLFFSTKFFKMIDQRLIEALFVDLVYLISQIIQTTFVEFLSLLQFGNINPIFGFLFSMFDKNSTKARAFICSICVFDGEFFLRRLDR